MKEENNYPEKYQGYKLKWIDNKPFHKKGDEVIAFRDGKYIKLILEKVSKEPMRLQWILQRRCRSCRKPGQTIEVGKYVYRWNDKAYTEGDTVDVIKTLNRLNEMVEDANEKIDVLSKKAALYDQIKESLDGNIIENW